MTKVVAFGSVLLSLSAIPVIYALSKFYSIKNENIIVGIFMLSLVTVIMSSILLFRRYFRKPDPTMYAFSFFCWTGVISGVLALDMDGFISSNSFLEFYILGGEPYLKTAFGTVLCYWDACVQTLLLIAAIALYTHRESHREVILYWGGSILNSVMVFIPGALTGLHKVNNTMFSNLFYFVVPVLIVTKCLHRSPIQARSFLKFPPIWRRPVDFLFVVFFKLAILVALFRLWSVLGGNVSFMKNYLKNYDPYLKDLNMFPKVQALTYGYFFVAYYAVTIYGLMFPGQHWMADWSIIHAGAAAQAQFCYVASAFHHLTPKELHAPSSGKAAYIYWTINILLFVVPQIFAFWCHRDPEKYGRTFTVDLAQPKQTYIVQRSVTTTTTTSRRAPRKSE